MFIVMPKGNGQSYRGPSFNHSQSPFRIGPIHHYTSLQTYKSENRFDLLDLRLVAIYYLYVDVGMMDGTSGTVQAFIVHFWEFSVALDP